MAASEHGTPRKSAPAGDVQISLSTMPAEVGQSLRDFAVCPNHSGFHVKAGAVLDALKDELRCCDAMKPVGPYTADKPSSTAWMRKPVPA
jgi:hypothetical protein